MLLLALPLLLLILLLLLVLLLVELFPEQIGLAGGVGGVGAPNLVIHMLRFCNQLKLVSPSSTFGDEPVLTGSDDAVAAIIIIDVARLHHPLDGK